MVKAMMILLCAQARNTEGGGISGLELDLDKLHIS
jgi:hypothetical protein